MANTQELYNKLKKDPLVNISLDYDTFVQKLDDSNFVDRINNLLSSKGEDVSVYGIQKKKKDGEDESSQPTEQPLENTEEIPTDGVDQSQVDTEEDVDPMNTDLSSYEMGANTPSFAASNEPMEMAPQPQNISQEQPMAEQPVVEQPVAQNVDPTQLEPKRLDFIQLAKNVKNRFANRHVNSMFGAIKTATADFEQEIKPGEETVSEVEEGGPGDPKRRDVKGAANSLYGTGWDEYNYQDAMKVLGSTRILGVKMDGDNYEVVFTNDKMGGGDQAQTYKGVIGDATWEGYVSNIRRASDSYSNDEAWEDLKSATITKDTYSPVVNGQKLEPNFSNNLTAHKAKYYATGDITYMQPTVSVSPESNEENSFGTRVKRFMDRASITIKTRSIIDKDSEERKEYNIARETVPKTEYVMDTEQSFYNSIDNDEYTNAIMQVNDIHFSNVMLPTSKNKEVVMENIKLFLAKAGYDENEINAKSGPIYTQMLRDARYHSAEQYIRHEIETGNKTFKLEDIDRLKQAKENRVDELRGNDALEVQADQNFVSNLWDISLSDYIDHYDARATVSGRNMDIKNIPGKTSAYMSRIKELEAQIESEKTKLNVPSKDQLNQSVKSIKDVKSKVDAYNSQLTQIESQIGSLIIEQDGKKYFKDEQSKVKYDDLLAQSNQIIGERDALVEQSKGEYENIGKVNKFQKNISRQIKEYEVLRKKLNYYNDDPDLLAVQGLSNVLTSIQDYQVDKSNGFKNDLYDFQEYRDKVKQDDEIAQKEAEDDNVLEAAGKGFTGGVANIFIGVAKTGMYGAAAIADDENVWEGGDALIAATNQLQENIGQWASNPYYEKWGLNWFINSGAAVIPDLAAIYFTGGGAGIAELAAQRGLLGAVGAIAVSPTTIYFTIRSTGDWADKLEKAGYSSGEAFLGGGIIAGAEAMIESLLPEFFSAAEKITVKSTFLEVAERGIAKGLAPELIAAELKESFKGIVKNYGKKTVTATVNEKIEEGTSAIFSAGASAAVTDETIQIFDPQTGGMGKTLEQITESAAIGGAVGFTGASIGGMRSIVKERSSNITLKLAQLQIGKKYNKIITEADRLSPEFKGSEVEKEYAKINKEYEKLSSNPNFNKYDDVAQAEVLNKVLTLSELKEAQKNYKEQNIVDAKLDNQIAEAEKELAGIIDVAQKNTDIREEMNKQLQEIGVQSFTLNANGDINGITFDKSASVEEQDAKTKQAIEIIDKVYKSKPVENAIQEPSTTEVLPSEQDQTGETGSERQGVEPVIEGEGVTQEVGKEKIEEHEMGQFDEVLVDEAKDMIPLGNLEEGYRKNVMWASPLSSIAKMFSKDFFKRQKDRNKPVSAYIFKSNKKPQDIPLENDSNLSYSKVVQALDYDFDDYKGDQGEGDQQIVDKAKELGLPDDLINKVVEIKTRPLSEDFKKSRKEEYARSAEIGNLIGEYLVSNGINAESLESERTRKEMGKLPLNQYRFFTNKGNTVLGAVDITPELAEKLSDENLSDEDKGKIIAEAAGVEYDPDTFVHLNTTSVKDYAKKNNVKVKGESNVEQQTTQKGVSEENAQQYLDRLNQTKKDRAKDYWSVSVPELQDVKEGTLIQVNGGEAVVSKDGEIKGVYKDPNSKEEKVGDKLVKKAIEAGGIKLDNFDLPNLMTIYPRNGFRVVARVAFNEEFAPEGWDKEEHGTPDVVAMIYDPENKLDIEEKKFTKDEYYEALDYQSSFIEAQKQAYPKTTETGTDADTEAKVQEERKSTADKIRGLKSEGGRAYSAGLGIPIAIWDGAVELIATSIEAGESFVNAINKAKEYLKQQLGDDYNEDTAEEFMDEVINQSPLQLNNTDKVKGTPVKVNPDGHNLSFVKEEDLIDIDALVKDIEAKNQTVWFWVADQLGRGYYMDSKTGEKHYLDAGPSYALDPKNREKNVIWASGVKETALNKNIKKADYIFIISGSPEKSKLFNKAVFQVFQEKIGDYNTFKEEVLASKPVKGIREVLEAHDSWESLIEDASVNGKKGKIGTGRKKFLNELVDASKKPNSSLYKVLKDRDALVNVDELRDGFYADNNFQQNDIMLVLKPEKVGGKSEHSTYENDLMGEVVGVPNKKINAYDILPDKLRGKDLKSSEQSQKIAPYGSGLKPVSASQNISRGLKEAAKLIRQGKRGGLAMNPIDPFLEVIAKALDAGASLAEAIAKGIEAFKNSDFYKNLTSQEKSKAVNDLKKAMDEQIAPSIANLINEEMLKGKGLYTAAENVKKQMIKDGTVDEATYDRIVGKAEKLVKADAEMMFSVATEDAKEAIKAGKSMDEAASILNDAINNQIGFYSKLDKSIKKDMVAKAQAQIMTEVAGEIAGAAKSYVDTQGVLKSEAIKQAMDEAKAAGINPKLVENLKASIESEYDKIKSRDRGDSNKKESVVTTTDKEIMKDKLKAMDSALKEAVAQAKQDKKDEKAKRQSTRNWVKEYLKTSGISSKISPTQLKAIVSRATGVVSDMTDAKMKALTDYVQKVVANQEYAQMINDLEKDKKGASKKRHNQFTEDVRKYLSLPLVNSDGTPLMNDQELKAYAESIARLNQSIPDHSAMDMDLANRVLNDYNEVPSKLEKSDFDDAVSDIKDSNIDDLETYNEFVKKVNKAKRILDSLYNNGKVTEEEYNEALNDLYTKENGLRVYEEKHQEQILDLKVNMLYDIIDMHDYIDKSGFIGQQADLLRRYEIMLTKPEMLTTLDVKDLVKLSEVMSRMGDGFMAEKEMREILNKAETRGMKKGESIVKQLSSIYKSLNIPDLARLRNLLKLTEPAQIERALGLSTGPIYNYIIQPINSAFTKMRKNTEKLMDKYYQARQNNKFKGNVVVRRSEYDKSLGSKVSDNITVKADKYYSTRVALLSSIFDYASKALDQKADTKDFWGENLDKPEVKKAYHNDGSLHVVKDIYSKLNNDPRFQTNGRLDYVKIYEAFVNDPSSVMSDSEYNLYQATQQINKEDIGAALVNANAIRGINGEISKVHYPRKSLGKSSVEDADLVAGTGGKVGGLRAGSSYSRVLETPKDAIDLNLDRVMATQITEASRDLYLNDAIQQTNEVFRNAKENANPDEKALLQAIQDWNRKRVDFEMERSVKNVVTRLFSGFAPYALIGKVRTLAEFTTNLLSGMANQLSNVVKIGPKALVSPVNPLQVQETKKIMEKFDSPVQFMGWNMKTYATYGNGKVDKNYLSSFYNNTVNMLMNISGPLTVGEWKADFDAKFNELTGERYNESKHLENDEYFYAMQEASSYANQQIERIKGGAFKGQGKQFVATLPIADIKKIFPGVKIKDEEGMVSANDTFAQMTNMFNNFVGRDVKNFVIGAKQARTLRDVTGGFKDMLGSAFRLGSYYVIYNLIDAAMKSAFGDDEEKEKGDKKLEMYTTSEGMWETAFNTVLNLATTVATSKYGANGRAIAVASLNYLYNSSSTTQEQKDMAADALKSMYFQDPIDTEKYGAAQKIIYTAATMYIPPADVIADQLQREFETLAGSDKYKGATITDFFDQTGKFFNDPDTVEFKKFLAGSLTLATNLALVSGKPVPFLKDIIKFIKKDIQDKQNIIITNKEGENLVDAVLDFDADGNGRLSVSVDMPGTSAEQKKAINESISNVATANFNKVINEKKSQIKNNPNDAMKLALIEYYADKAKYDAKLAARIKDIGEEPKAPGSSNKASDMAKEDEKMYKNYIDARAKNKFKSISPIANSKKIQENVNSLIESSEYKDAYKALNSSNIEDAGAIKAVNEYFYELYKYNTTPNMTTKPYPSDYFDNSSGKIIAVQ